MIMLAAGTVAQRSYCQAPFPRKLLAVPDLCGRIPPCIDAVSGTFPTTAQHTAGYGTPSTQQYEYASTNVLQTSGHRSRWPRT
ncbi:MAG: hypothetical protein MZV63_18680 [Marinilabiliales bacterium]|nr:hypothetical protein [Marinilabiliales bacterium]